VALVEISVVQVGPDGPLAAGPTRTVMEGDVPALMQIAQDMHRAAFHDGTHRVVTNISIDERRDKDQSMEATVAAASTR